ncbi:MAG: hypothetical protein IKQ33_05310 [Clostridia bacterium]|nr:hypothetical protein [Clostridia bacterium]
MKNKIFIGLSAIILIGIIVVAIFKFNVGYSYKNHMMIDVKIGKEYNVSDIKNITNEVFGKQNVEIQKSGTYSDNVVIKVENVTDEQKELLNTKINEKFGIENSVDDMKVNKISSFRLRDIAKSYIIPVGISMLLILVYMIVRFKKIGIKKVLIQTVLLTVIAELLYVAILGIVRYPINRLVLPVGVVIYLAMITVLTASFEKELAEDKE